MSRVTRQVTTEIIVDDFDGEEIEAHGWELRGRQTDAEYHFRNLETLATALIDRPTIFGLNGSVFCHLWKPPTTRDDFARVPDIREAAREYVAHLGRENIRVAARTLETHFADAVPGDALRELRNALREAQDE